MEAFWHGEAKAFQTLGPERVSETNFLLMYLYDHCGGHQELACKASSILEGDNRN
jgi:hypothetical protein